MIGVNGHIVRAFGEALEIIPYTLAENAGMGPILFVTELRNRHINGDKFVGLSVRKNSIMDMLE